MLVHEASLDRLGRRGRGVQPGLGAKVGMGLFTMKPSAYAETPLYMFRHFMDPKSPGRSWMMPFVSPEMLLTVQQSILGA